MATTAQGPTTRSPQRKSDVRDDVAAYRRFHDEQQGGDVEQRKTGYADMVRSYYNLVTDFYEFGWGQAFHFAPRKKGESREASIIRHEHFLAARLGLRPGMKVLDVGAGVGGPMREIATFSGAEVVGVNNNGYQVEKARRYIEEARLGRQCSMIEADFMSLPVPDASFDAVYAIEATCHSPDKPALFRELHRVLKPGGYFAGYEWCLTSDFDSDDAEHQRIKKGIEEGDSLPDIATIPQTLQALETAGFEVVESQDLAPTCDPETPWYLPLTGQERTWLGIRRTPLGRRITRRAVQLMERTGIAPKGTSGVSDVLNVAADALVAAGEKRIFTPMFFFHARK